MIRIFEMLFVLCGFLTAVYVFKKHFDARHELQLKKLQNECEATKLLLVALQETSSQRIQLILNVHRDKLSKQQIELLEQRYDDLLIKEDAARYNEYVTQKH